MSADNPSDTTRESTPNAKFALDSVASSACVTVVDYGVLGTQIMHGPCDNRGDWTRRQACEPDSRIAIVDPAGLRFIQETCPYKAGCASGAIYKWLGIEKWRSFPTQVIYKIKAETLARLHAYTCKGYENYGPISVIHVASPDLRTRPDTKHEEVVGALAQAYANVLSQFNHSGLRRLRLLPISSGTFSGRFQTELPALTAEAIHAAYRSLPLTVQATLETTSIELCIYDEFEHRCYVNAFEMLANKMPERHADDAKTTHAVTKLRTPQRTRQHEVPMSPKFPQQPNRPWA